MAAGRALRRPATRSPAALALIALALVAASMPASATCLLGHPGVDEEWAASDAVLSGTVTHGRLIREAGDPDGYVATVYTLTVDRSWRGAARRTIEVYSVNTTARFPMRVGDRMFLFVRRSRDGETVNGCGNSGVYADTRAARARVAELARRDAAQR